MFPEPEQAQHIFGPPGPIKANRHIGVMNERSQLNCTEYLLKHHTM